MRRRRDAILFAAGLGVVGGLCWHFGVADLAAAVRQARPVYLLVYVACGLGALTCYVLRWRLVTAAVGRRPPFRRLVAARLAGDAVGALVPSAKLAGDPIRVVLVHRDGESGPRASAGVAVDRILESLTNSVCAVAYVGFFLTVHARGPSAHSVVILFGAMLVLLVLLVVPVLMLQRGQRPLSPLYQIPLPQGARWLRQLLAGMYETEGLLLGFFRDHPSVFLRGLVLSVLAEGVQILQFGVLFASFGIRLDVATLLMVLLATGLSRAVPLPAAVGVLESSELAVVMAASAAADIGFVVAMLVRVHETLWMMAGLMVLWSEGLRIGYTAGDNRAGFRTEVAAPRIRPGEL